MSRSTGVVLTRTERVPGTPSAAGWAVAALYGVSWLGLVLAGVLDLPGWFVVAAVLLTAAELLLERVSPLLPWALTRTSLARPARWAVALCALLVLMQVGRESEHLLVWWVLGTGLALTVLAALVEGLAQVVEYLRKSPVLSRGLDVAAVRIAPEPRWLLGHHDAALVPSHLLLLVAPALAVGGTISVGAAVGATVVALVLAVLVAAAALQAARATRASGARTKVPAAVQQAVDALEPELVLYFGGGPDSLYQLEMWLPALESSGHRTLVVLRDRDSLRMLAETSLPVLCIPAGTVLMAFDLTSVRGALFVANAATNIHLLRKRGMRTVFIGHGDSDKASSSNPFVKVYDEIWVAGPAGAERYDAEETATVASRIRQVGRPQAVPAAPSRRQPGHATVLYAPTWEGWGDEPFHSSLPFTGVELVRRLLATEGVRVLYRPHPLTGTQSAAVRSAHEEILRLLRRAGAPLEQPSPPQEAQPQQAAERDRGADDLTLMLGRSRPQDPAVREQRARAEAQAREAFWSAAGPDTPRVVEGPWPGLASTFAQSDLLVADVSSIVSDWIALDRPYAVLDSAGLDPDEFAHRYPSSRGATVLRPDLSGLDDLVAAVLAGLDPRAEARHLLAAELLGTPPGSGLRRFHAALDDLVATPALPAHHREDAPA